MKQCHWLGYNHKRGKKSFFKDETEETNPPPEKIKTLAFPIYLINRSLIVPYNSIMTINLCSKLCLQEISRVSNNCTSVKLPGMKGRLCRKNHIEMILAKSSIAAVFSSPGIEQKQPSEKAPPARICKKMKQQYKNKLKIIQLSNS